MPLVGQHGATRDLRFDPLVQLTRRIPELASASARGGGTGFPRTSVSCSSMHGTSGRRVSPRARPALGYAYLEAVRVASVRAGARRVDPAETTPRSRCMSPLQSFDRDRAPPRGARCPARGDRRIGARSSGGGVVRRENKFEVEVVQAESRGRDPWLFLLGPPASRVSGLRRGPKTHTDASSQPRG